MKMVAFDVASASDSPEQIIIKHTHVHTHARTISLSFSSSLHIQYDAAFIQPAEARGRTPVILAPCRRWYQEPAWCDLSPLWERCTTSVESCWQMHASFYRWMFSFTSVPACQAAFISSLRTVPHVALGVLWGVVEVLLLASGRNFLLWCSYWDACLWGISNTNMLLKFRGWPGGCLEY